jgi:hypothetical protein
VKAWNLESTKSRISEDGQFGNLSEVKFGSLERGNSRTREEAKSKLTSQKVRA